MCTTDMNYIQIVKNTKPDMHHVTLSSKTDFHVINLEF